MTITCSVNSVSYLDIRCLNEWEVQEGHHFTLTKGIFTNSVYVEDIVAGVNSGEDLSRILNRIIEVLQVRSCKLMKWTSNYLIFFIIIFIILYYKLFNFILII